jgi:nitroreductase
VTTNGAEPTEKSLVGLTINWQLNNKHLPRRTIVSIKELVLKNRTYRRFHQDYALDRSILRELVDLARLSSSGANLQSLKYLLSTEPELNARIFPTLGWAGYLKEWGGPEEGERPGGYIVVLFDQTIAKTPFWDHGIAAQSILLGATERGLGGCMFGNIRKDELSRSLGIGEHLEILLVIALGKPKEEVRLVPIGPDGDVKYYRDADGVHYVPKRALDDIIIN